MGNGTELFTTQWCKNAIAIISQLLRNGESYGLQIWPVHSHGPSTPSEQNPMKNLGEKRLGDWAYPGTHYYISYPMRWHLHIWLRLRGCSIAVVYHVTKMLTTWHYLHMFLRWGCSNSVNSSQNWFNSIEVFYKEVDIEASKPASSTPIRYDTMMSVTTAMTTATVRLLVSDTIWVLSPIGIPSVDASV